MRLYGGGSCWIPGSDLTSHSMRTCRKAFLRLLALGAHAKKPRERGSFSWARPLGGRRPPPQEGPSPFHAMAMDCTEAVALFLSGVLASSMGNLLMVLSPGTPTCSKTGGVRRHKRPWRPRRFHARLQLLASREPLRGG